MKQREEKRWDLSSPTETTQKVELAGPSRTGSEMSLQQQIFYC